LDKIAIKYDFLNLCFCNIKNEVFNTWNVM
jgi:hypothetical protein